MFIKHTKNTHTHTQLIFFIKIFFGQEQKALTHKKKKKEKLRQNCIKKKKFNVIKKGFYS